MKNLLITIIALLFTITLNAQTPKGFKYQAVIYDSEGELISEGEVSIKTSNTNRAISKNIIRTISFSTNTSVFL